MTQEIVAAFSGCIRAFLISIFGQAMGILISSTMMKPRRSVWKLYAFTCFKTLVGLVLIDLDNALWAGGMTDTFFDTLISALAGLGTYAMFAYTYHGGTLKALIGMGISEILVSLIWLPVILVVNFLEGRSDLYLFYGQLEWMDLLIIPISLAMLAIVYLPFRKLMGKYRMVELKYRPVLWVVLISFYAGNQIMAAMDTRDNSIFVMTMYIFYLTGATVAVVLLYLSYWRYQSQIHMEQEFLGAQMNLIETHYTAVQNQMERISQVQKNIDEQMKRLQSAEFSVREERTMGYLGELQKEYRELRAGVYCKDWMVDGILYCQEEAAKKLGIHVEYQLGSYHRGKVSEQDMAQLVYLLLDEGIRRQAGRMSLRAGLVKGRVILELQLWDAEKKVRFAKRRYTEILGKYDGTVMSEKNRSGMRIAATLQG